MEIIFSGDIDDIVHSDQPLDVTKLHHALVNKSHYEIH